MEHFGIIVCTVLISVVLWLSISRIMLNGQTKSIIVLPPSVDIRRFHANLEIDPNETLKRIEDTSTVYKINPKSTTLLICDKNNYIIEDLVDWFRSPDPYLVTHDEIEVHTRGKRN